jgi:hypothetical protein
MRFKVKTILRLTLFPALFLTLAIGPLAASVPDSTLIQRDPFQPPPLDSAAVNVDADTNPLEAVKLSAHGAFTNLSPRVGDSLDYVLQVEWEESQVPVMVLAPDSLDFSGFKVLGQATVHKKLAGVQSIRNHTEFIYRLRAQIQGSGRVSSLKVRYITGLSGKEEALFIPTALLDIAAAPVNLLDRVWFKLLAGLIVFGGAVFLAWGAYRITLRTRKKAEPTKLDLRPEVTDLKNRMKSAASSPDAAREILLAMESLGILYLQQELKNQTQTKFEPLLEGFLASTGNADSPGTQDWVKLKELFRHARFAGGYKEPHELQDAFKTFKRCLKITGEDEHE